MLRARYNRILRFFAGVILSLLWWEVALPAVGLRKWAARGRKERLQRVAVRFRALAVDMGGVLIKVGQFLSTRMDVLPPDITAELAGLQDEVQPEPFANVVAVLEAEFGLPLTEKFSWFDEEPVAAASIGQVHRACLAGSDCRPNVVVKVQRRLIPQIVETDLAALAVVARWIDRYPPLRRRADMPRLIGEFSQSLREEIDYLNEGRNAETFAQNFANRPEVRVPRVHWTHTTRRVLCLEDVQAIKISDTAAIEAAGIPRSEVASRLFDTYLKQIFEDRFFHADPHPGNLFVQPGERGADGKVAWKLTFIDFGMTGTLTPHVMQTLRDALIGIALQDAERVVRAYQDLDALLPGADTEQLRRATQRVFERFWGKTANDILKLSPREALAFIDEFGDLLYQMPFQVPENMILLARCVAILSGMCTGLDENFNPWSAVMPYTRKLVEAEQGSGLQAALNEVLDVLRIIATLPRRTDQLLTRIEQGRLELRDPELRAAVGRTERAVRQMGAAVVLAALILGGVQLYLAGEWLATGVFAAAALVTLAVGLLRR